MHAERTLAVAVVFALLTACVVGGWEPATTIASAEGAPLQAPLPQEVSPQHESQQEEPLPGEAPAASTREGPEADLPQINGPRDWLQGHGLDDSHFERLTEGAPVDGSDTEVLLSVIYWLEHLRLTLLDRWTRKDWELAELVRQTDENRGEIFRLSGRVEAVEVLEPVPEVVDRLDLPRYYRCRFALPNGQPALVFASHVPETWRKNTGDEAGGGPPPEGYRASAQALFLKLAGPDPQHPTPVFVTTRIAWHPATPLGNLGMDVGLLEAVEDRRPLTGKDRECFYQMLAAVGRTEPRKLLRLAQDNLADSGKEQYSVVPLFNEAASQRGDVVALHGVTRRLVKIQVSDPDIVERFGIDHYYEMALYTGDSRGNPLWFCLLELPDGMPTGDGPDYAEEVHVAGFFMKTWAYRSQEVEPEAEGDEGPQQRLRLAPLLIGRQPVWYPRQPQSENTVLAAIAGGLFVLALIGVWIGVWYSNRSDRKFHERTIAKSHGMDSGISLDEIGLDAEGKPDFSGLSEEGPPDEDSRP